MMTRRLLMTVLALTCLTPALAQEQSRERWRGHWPKPELREAEVDGMATIFWVSTDGDANNVASYSTGAKPVDTDTLIFDGSSQRDVSLNLDALAAVELTRLWRKDTYTGKIGTSSSPLQVAAAKALLQGPGATHLKHHTITKQVYIIDMADPTVPVSIDGSGSILHVVVKRGSLTVRDTCETVDRLWVTYHDNPANDANIEMLGTGDVSFVWMNGGFVLSYRRMDDGARTYANIYGGTWQQEGAQYVGYRIAGGHVIHNTTGLLNLAHVAGGMLDFTQSAAPRSVTELVVLPGGDYMDDDSITYTNPVQDYRKHSP